MKSLHCKGFWRLELRQERRRNRALGPRGRQKTTEKNKKLIDKKNRNRNAVRMRTRIITRGKRLRRGRGRKEYGDKHLRNEKEEF